MKHGTPGNEGTTHPSVAHARVCFCDRELGVRGERSAEVQWWLDSGVLDADADEPGRDTVAGFPICSPRPPGAPTAWSWRWAG
jgi:hypothetical protein